MRSYLNFCLSGVKHFLFVINIIRTIWVHRREQHFWKISLSKKCIQLKFLQAYNVISRHLLNTQYFHSTLCQKSIFIRLICKHILVDRGCPFFKGIHCILIKICFKWPRACDSLFSPMLCFTFCLDIKLINLKHRCSILPTTYTRSIGNECC